MMKPLFSELVEIKELQSLCEIFSNLTGFGTAILDMEGNVLTSTNWQEICLEFHRKYPAAAEACRKSDIALGELPSPGAKYRVYRCNNGLIDVSVPIMVENLQIGRLYTGQFLFAPPDVEFFRRQAARYGFNETPYLEALQKVQIVTEEQVGQVLEFLCRLAEMIGRMGLGNQKLREANEELRKNRQELERRVDERTAQLSAKNEQLQREINERKLAEEALRFTQFAIDKATDQAFWMTEDGCLFYVNDAACHTLGYAREELIGMSIPDIVPTFPPEVFAEHWRDLQKNGYATFESWHRAKDGRVYPVEIRANYVVFDGREYNCVFATDITDRKQAEEKIRAALAEKEVLLKEIHHRVKNNLQIITTLLDLQSYSIFDEHALQAFSDSQDRIKAMALIHEMLYRSMDLAHIDFAEYIEKLAIFLINSYIADPDQITLKVEVGPLSLEIDRAIPCGLIINELVSNALKYAFPDGRKGEIMIRLRCGDDGQIGFTVADNGIGLPPGLDFRNTGTLGLQVVTMLVKQLHGQIEMSDDHGTLWEITFSAIDNGKSASD